MERQVSEYAVHIPDGREGCLPWQCFVWLEQQGWRNHRMSHLHGVNGKRFMEWDLVQPQVKGHQTYMFRDPQKAMMFKLAMGGL